MSNNRKLGNLAQFLDSGSTKSVITATGGAFATEPLLEADLTGTAPTGLSDSNLVKNLIDINHITEISGYASVSDAIPVILQNTNNIIPDSAGAYDLGDSAKPIAELILDSSANIFFGALSLTSVLRSGTSAIAVAAAAPASPVAGSAETTFLLKTDSTLTDAQVDASTNSLTITESGNLTSTAFTPYHPKGYSVYFDGSGDYLTIPYDASFSYSSVQPFTIDMWFYPLVSSTDAQHIASSNNGSSGDAGLNWLFRQKANNTLRFVMIDQFGTVVECDSSDSMNINEWNHVSIVMTGSSIKHWLNGVFQQELSFTGTPQVNGNIDIGRWGSTYYNGYVSDFRYNVGEEIYTGTADISVPTERLTTNSYTKALLCHLPYIADGSSNDLSITVAGDTHTQQFGPYDHVAYLPSSHGGSTYHDGSGDELNISPSASELVFGTDPYTVEFWIYLKSAATGGHHIYGANSTGGFLVYYTSAKIAINEYNVSDKISYAQTPELNTWTHYAFVREGTGTNQTKIYKNGILVSTGTDNMTWATNTSWTVGGNPNSAQDFNGHISDLRVVKGTAVYTADFTPPTEPLTAISGTQLLTCTNKNSIYDAAGGTALNKVGDATVSTTQYKWSSSLYVDGNGDYVQTVGDNQFGDLGTGDFTVEFWVKMGSQNTHYSGVGTLTSSAVGSWRVILAGWGDRNNVYFATYTSNFNDYLINNSVVNDNVWHHVAVTREDGLLRGFVDGTLDTGNTHTVSESLTSGNEIYIGAETYTPTYMSGYFDDIRITKGLARYTANFTPPTAALEG